MLSTDVHWRINGHYQSKNDSTGGKRVREVINKRSWSAQYEYGLSILRDHGVEP